MARLISPVEISTPRKSGVYKATFYPGKTNNGFPSDYSDIITVAPGWLGSGTMHVVASTLAEAGHDVVVANHPKIRLLQSNKDREQDVHFATRAASVQTGKKTTRWIGYSHGVRDTHGAAQEVVRRQLAEPDNEALYALVGLASVAGAGLSDKKIQLRNLYREVYGAGRELIRNPREEFMVVGRSLLNFSINPIEALSEGRQAVTCDIRPIARSVIRATDTLEVYDERYYSHDGVITAPTERDDFTKRSGGHLTFVVDRDEIRDVGQKLYVPNLPRTLQIAA